jgi:hypothetical protein
MDIDKKTVNFDYETYDEIKYRIDDLEKQPTKVLLAVFQTLKGLK